MSETWIKIGYRDIDGRERTAYVLEQPDHRGVHTGIDKWTDEDVAVRWDDALETWYEVALNRTIRHEEESNG